MSKRNKLIIIIAVVSVLIIFIIFKIAKKDKNKIYNNNSEKITSAEIKYDEETSLYYVQDKKTGEIIAAGEDKTALQMYVDNPDYNPNPLEHRTRITDLNAYKESLNLLYDYESIEDTQF